ncbi:FkbM family methyltransferase [Aestuariibius sp. 2305UL40-4]|uniref:FkbM family methyltransferase n=1 Tax=Aestuariibius violaceus TaxID=3234132 RepID=UPI00349069C7
MSNLNVETPPARVPKRRRLRQLARALNLPRPMAVVDVGANPINTPSYENLLRVGAGRLVGFEPDPAAFEALQKEAANGDRTYLPYAIGPEGRYVFRAHQINSLSSLFPFRPAAARFMGKMHWIRRRVDEIEMDLHQLDRLEDVPPIDFLKMDAQGAELAILEGGRQKLSKAVAIMPEVAFYRIYDGQPLMRDIDQEMERQGFVLHKILFQKPALLPSSQSKRLHRRRAASQSIDGDAVWIRNMEEPEDLTSDQIKHLALCADSVFESPDLVLMCLDILVARGEVTRKLPSTYVDMLPPEVLADPVAARSDE